MDSPVFASKRNSLHNIASCKTRNLPVNSLAKSAKISWLFKKLQFNPVVFQLSRCGAALQNGNSARKGPQVQACGFFACLCLMQITLLFLVADRYFREPAFQIGFTLHIT